jgi:hypothetical protein
MEAARIPRAQTTTTAARIMIPFFFILIVVLLFSGTNILITIPEFVKTTQIFVKSGKTEVLLRVTEEDHTTYLLKQLLCRMSEITQRFFKFPARYGNYCVCARVNRKFFT